MENVYLGRQPILDSNDDLVAYEILYRDSSKSSDARNEHSASASVISNILNKFGTKSLLGDRRAFVKVDEMFLLHDIIFSIPKEFFIFSLLENVQISEKVVERLKQLHIRGYILAIHNISLDLDSLQKYSQVYTELSYIKINVDKDINLDMQDKFSEIKSHNIQIVASKIEDNSEYELAKKLGCDMFQGYFFAKPNIVQNAKNEASQLKVLSLYNMLINDTSIDEITLEFENNYEITVQLLRYMNSCAFHFRNKISSISQILSLVGREPLAKWLLLMIYSKSLSKTFKHSPLMLMVKSRTELMENILEALNHDVTSKELGEAYFVGVLSLVDTLFGVEIEEVLQDLNISDEVTNALLKDEGMLGEIYSLIRDIEAFDTSSIHIFTSKYNLGTHQIEDIVLKSMQDVNSFEEAMTE
ncbi:MAG: EAL and modified HD-GYP domain-containing signal transduction protein [Sulfurimonas sp.]|jgi:EAL and modified HD-GYP domain-containing signal transduction protein